MARKYLGTTPSGSTDLVVKSFADSGTETLTNKDLTSGTNTFPTFNQSTTGNAATATKLATARAINGVNFDGTAAITNRLDQLSAPTAAVSMGSQKLTNLTDPTNPQDGATKNYVDASVQGLQVKPTATVVATSALPAGTYANGTSGVGATFTVTATGTTTVDGHVLAANDLVLLTAQASAFQNGLYTVTTAGATGVATVLTRHVDMDSALEFSGGFVPVGSTGTTNPNSLWLANPSTPVTVGTTSIPFTELNRATDLSQGTGITISGNQVSIDNSVVATLTGTQALTHKTLTDATNVFPTFNQNTTGTSGGITGKTTPSGALVGTTDAQALTNKDLTGAGNTFPTLNQSTTGNAATATKLATARTISGVSFDGSANITLARPNILETITTSAASTLTLTTASSCYVFNGTTTTWTLPAVSGNMGFPLIIENVGSGAITLNAAGTDHIWFLSQVTSVIIATGGSLTLVCDGTNWNALSLDLAHNSVGILPVANGGTGQGSLTSLGLTTPTISGYTETVQALGTMGSTKTIGALSNGTEVWGTLTTATPCTVTMPTAAAGLNFLCTIRQPASGTATTVTFTGVKWPGGTAPTLTATLGKADVFGFHCYDGTNWYGTFVQNYTY